MTLFSIVSAIICIIVWTYIYNYVMKTQWSKPAKIAAMVFATLSIVVVSVVAIVILAVANSIKKA